MMLMMFCVLYFRRLRNAIFRWWRNMIFNFWFLILLERRRRGLNGLVRIFENHRITIISNYWILLNSSILPQFSIKTNHQKISGTLIPEANHCKISPTVIRVPLIHDFPDRMSGSIKIYDNNSFIIRYLLIYNFSANIIVFADICKKTCTSICQRILKKNRTQMTRIKRINTDF